MKQLSALVWVFIIAFSGQASGQGGDSLSLQQDRAAAAIKDSIAGGLPQDSPAYSDTVTANTDTARQDSILFTRKVIVGLSDPLDTVTNRTFAYQILDENSYARLQIAIDTTLVRFEINNPVMKTYYAGSYLGNVGLSCYPVGFEARRRPSDFIFADNVSLYMHIPEETKYYQTRTPYTLIDYSSAGSKSQNESIFNLVHTQNVNKNWNVGLYYDIISSAGQYLNQNAADNGFSLFSAYRGSQYSLYANFNWNNIRMKENGGLVDVNNFMDTDYAPETNAVRSQTGKTIFLNRSLFLRQSYSLRKPNLFKKNMADSVDVSRFTLVHTFKYEWNKREYFDTATYATRVPYYRTADTHDSLHFRRIFNHFELMFKEQTRNKITAGFSVGILSELDRYNNNIVPDTSLTLRKPYIPPENNPWGSTLPVITGSDMLITYRRTKTYSNTAITGRFFNHTGRYLNWDFNGRFYFTGYKPGNMNINGTVQLHYYTAKGRSSLLLGGSIENARPGYFLNDYASNWLAWNNDFRASQEIRLRGEFIVPHRKFKIGAYISQLNNYVYINADAQPEQAPDLIMTGTAFVEKDIHWWKLGFLFRLYGQYSSHEKIIPLPLFAGYQSTYFETWLVRNVLTMRLGWDISYNTRYYAYAYMPSSGMFHLQNEQKMGNYPFFDVFLNFQIKRARIFVKTEGLNTLLNDYIGKEYFMVYRYPLNELRVKFGISWAFYD
jgi:hypothetical protein